MEKTNVQLIFEFPLHGNIKRRTIYHDSTGAAKTILAMTYNISRASIKLVSRKICSHADFKGNMY